MISYQASPYLRASPVDCVVRPRIVRVNDFDEPDVARFRRELQRALNTGQPIIPVIVDSYGGDLHGLFAMIDLMKSASMHATIATIVEGKAMSAGAVLLSAGERGHRYVAPTSTVMFHEVRGAFHGPTTDTLAHAAEMHRVNSILFEMLDKNAGKKSGFFEGLTRKVKNVDSRIGPETAVELGLADHVGLPQMRIEVDVQFAFGIPQEQPSKDSAPANGRRARRGQS